MNNEARKVRYAVVGLGNIAQVAVLPAFAHAKENSELVALVSSDTDKLRELSKKYDVATTGSYDELEAVLREARVDAVYVTVPNSLHREIVERAAHAGANVLCEKPLAPSVVDCQAMIATARAHGVLLMTGYRLHFDASNLDVIARVRRGEIGEPRFFSSVFSHQVMPGDIRTRGDLGGGALLDMGIYCINAARNVFGAEPLSVMAMQVLGTDPRFRDVDEMTTAIVRFPGECIAQITASQGAADVSQFEVVGTTGTIALEPAYDYADRLRETVTTNGTTHKHKGRREDQFAPELVHFSNRILDRATPEPTGEEGLADVRVVEAIVRSAKTGVVVALPPAFRSVRPTPDLAMRKPPVGRQRPIHAPSPSHK
jgi:predicted dehydrogenase